MKSKPRNQRISNSRARKQQHLLEVNVRAEKARSMRQRAILGWSLRLCFAALIIGGGWIGGQELLRRFVWENPDYLLTDVRVSTDGALQREQILQAAGIRTGVNIFTIDSKGARNGLDQLPQVERAEIQRVLPNRVDITIIERRPIAWVTEKQEENPTSNEKAWLIDARGVVMRSRRVLEEYFLLPHISGAPAGDYVAGQRINTVEMQAALELVRRTAEQTRWQPRNIDLSKGYCLIVTDQNHARITFGLDEIELQIDRLHRYLDRADMEKMEIQTVNLIVRKNTPITFHTGEIDDSKDAAIPVADGASDPRGETSPGRPATPVARAVPVATPMPVARAQPASSRTSTRDKPAPMPVRKPFRP
jgi:cell division septal protein FtsQ